MFKFNVIITVVILTLVIFAGGVFLLSKSGSNSSNINTAPVVSNQPATSNQLAQKLPDFTLPKYDGTGDVNLATYYNDKPTIIQFWATWCEICRHEFPVNKAIIADKYKDKVSYIAVDWAQRDRNAVKDYIKELELDPSIITFVMDADGRVGALFGVRGTPVHLFIKKGGEVSFAQTGGLRPQTFEEELKKIL